MPKAFKRASAQAVSAYTPVVRRSYKPRPNGHDPFFDLPFVSYSKRGDYIFDMNAWSVPATEDYGDACRAGREFAANFAQYLKDNSDEAGSNALGLIVRGMDFSGNPETNGYWVGFLSYLEELIVLAAKRSDIFNAVDKCNMRSLIVEAELEEEETA